VNHYCVLATSITQSEAFLNGEGSTQTVNVQAVTARIGYFHMKYFFHFCRYG